MDDEDEEVSCDTSDATAVESVCKEMGFAMCANQDSR